MKHCPQAALARATARAHRFTTEAPEVLRRLTDTALNAAFFAQRLAALQQVHRRQLARLQDVFSPPTF